MLLAVLSGFVLALLAPWLYKIGRDATGWILALLPLGLFVYFVGFIEPVAHGEAVTYTYAWIPSLNVNLSFYVDGLSLLFALIISGVGTLIVLYGSGYLAHDRDVDRFFVYILMFMASMLGVVLSNNLVSLFVFWELTSLTSYLLIGYYHEKDESRFAALQAMLVTGAGGLVMLAGFVMLAWQGGSWEISSLFEQANALQANALYLPMLILILVGAFTKSAQFPFHFWLPGAMAAPAPVSAYLHSATMVKAGVYLVARMSPILGGTEAWLYIVTGFGAVTMIIGAYIAWQQTDLKRILAYSTVSALGILMMLLGLGDHIAVEAAMVYLVVHSMYKGSLFMIAGAVDHETGQRHITGLGGLFKAMPFSGAAAVLAAASMSGLPLFLGFVGKELIYEATLEAHLLPVVITALAVVTNILTVVAAAMVSIKPFFGPPIKTPKHAHEAPWSMRLGPITLASLGLLLGALPFTVEEFGNLIVSPAASGILAEALEVHLHVLPTALNTIVMLSAITVLGGIGLYAIRSPLGQIVAPLNAVSVVGPEQWYRWSLDGMMMFAKWQTRMLQSGYLRYYLIITILTTVGLAGTTMVVQGVLQNLSAITMTEVYPHEILIVLVILGATVLVLRTASRLTAVAGLGVVGFSIALLFVLFGAPDLAMTQFSIETLSVILLVLVLYKLPTFTNFSTRYERVRDLIISLTCGILITTLVLIETALPINSRLTPYFAENSLLLARGHNVVNVILVDFRGFDTMGEITVLGMAALGVYGLLKLRLGKSSSEKESKQPVKRVQQEEVYNAPVPVREKVDG
ncbi:MAG: putative monovalent cation/H+ antiporter subunit A [Anaerolineaceae bacterium]|nr:putative monovalent cation/H+ antiporter subunit A [Anaerolineaceae bacterium]